MLGEISTYSEIAGFNGCAGLLEEDGEGKVGSGSDGVFEEKRVCAGRLAGQVYGYAISDGHGIEIPCGVRGTGHYGTGTGEKNSPRDVPVPVWAGDGSVTASVRNVDAVTRQHSRRRRRSPPPQRNSTDRV